MATVPIGIKVDEKVKARIDQLVELGRYSTVSDFIHHAIAGELERGGLSNEEYVQQMADRVVAEGLISGRFNDEIEMQVRRILGQVIAPMNSNHTDE